MPLPNTFIMGAPKCGTTALAEYLAQHPQVCTSGVKETYYFLDQTDPLYHLLTRWEVSYHNNGLEALSSYFAHCTDQARVILEASPQHIYQQTALEVLPQLNPPVKLLFMLRRPADQLLSLFRYEQNAVASFPQNISFREFLEMLDKPEGTPLKHHGVLRLAKERCRYVNYLLPYLEVTQPGQLHVYLTEQMRQDTPLFMQRVSRDLGINPAFYEGYHLPAVNEAFTVRNQTLHKIIRIVKRRLPLTFRWNVIRTSRLKQLYRRLNTTDAIPMQAEDLACLEALDQAFEADNRRLAEAFHLDLALWQRPRRRGGF